VNEASKQTANLSLLLEYKHTCFNATFINAMLNSKVFGVDRTALP
jgi:hypothetical protein